MTVRELIDELQRYIAVIPKIADYKVRMFDRIDGDVAAQNVEFLYNNLNDVTLNHDEQALTLWKAR